MRAGGGFNCPMGLGFPPPPFGNLNGMVDYSVPASPQVTRERVYKQRDSRRKTESDGPWSPQALSFLDSQKSVLLKISGFRSECKGLRTEGQPRTV